MTDTLELYKKYRPQTLTELHGNTSIKQMLKKWLAEDATPHCILFQGGSGMGKTTIARVLRKRLDCSDRDLVELNAAGEARGIETIRTIQSRMHMAPLGGKCRVWIIDEAHKLTGDAQNALLKILEDTPRHVYFFLCTTDPQKLLPTIKTRASVVTVTPLSTTEMQGLLKKVMMKEDFDVSEDVVDAIVEVADGGARKALVLLHSVRYVEGEEQQLALVKREETQRQAIDLCRLLIDKKNKWPTVAKYIKELKKSEGFEAESFRWMMLAYAESIVLSGGPLANRAFCILNQFSTNYYDTKTSGLVVDCWELVNG
jgi:DNA polymerase III gamma/tau subunit